VKFIVGQIKLNYIIIRPEIIFYGLRHASAHDDGIFEINIIVLISTYELIP